MVRKAARIIIAGTVLVILKLLLDMTLGIALIDLAIAIVVGFLLMYFLAKHDKKNVK